MYELMCAPLEQETSASTLQEEVLRHRCVRDFQVLCFTFYYFYHGLKRWCIKTIFSPLSNPVKDAGSEKCLQTDYSLTPLTQGDPFSGL